MEALLDRGSPLHWVAVLVLAVSGVPCAWIGLRDGFVRRRMETNGGPLEGARAMAAGAMYLAFGLAGLAGAAVFLLRGR